MKEVFVVISEVSQWDIEILEDDIAIGTTLHYKPIEEGETPMRIQDGEYKWDGNTIQVDKEGKVVMINGETADVELKKADMPVKEEKKKGLFAKVEKWFEDHGLTVKVKEEDPETEKMAKDKEEKLAKLKAFAKEKFGEERAEKFVDVTLLDGTMAIVEPALEVGAAMVIMDEEGNAVAAPVGEYELEDGMVVVVTEEMGEGIIAEIREAAEEEEEEEPAAEEEEMEEETAEEEQKVKRIIESIVKESVFVKSEDFNKVVQDLDEEKKTTKFLKEENETLVKYLNDQQEFIKELFKDLDVELDELFKRPAKKPKVTNKNPLAKEEKENLFFKPYQK